MKTRRLRVSISWILVVVLIVAGVASLVKFRSFLRSSRLENRVNKNSVLSVLPTITANHGTRSMAELGFGVGGVPELSGHVIFFNRVPKSGSEMLVLLLQWLQGMNNFRHIRLGGGNERQLDLEEQEVLVEEVSKKIREEAVPVTFDRHVYFLNFTHFGRQSPAFLNIVRDPVDKALSRFYYRRVTPNPRAVDPGPSRPTISFRSDSFEQCVEAGDAECRFEDGLPYDLAIPYFCGHQPWCMFLNDARALRKAKENVERYFPVVGVLEEMNATLAVLENRLPYFFKGVQDIYYNELQEPHKNKNRKRPREVSRSVRKYLVSNLRTEYEFYNWIYARLLRQYLAIS